MAYPSRRGQKAAPQDEARCWNARLRLPRGGLAEGGLRRGEPGDRHAVRRAGDVIESDRVAECHRGWIAAVFAADADLEIGAGLAAALKGDLIKGLAATSLERLPGFENLPTVAETVPGFFVGAWNVMVSPLGTPDAVVRKVNADLRIARIVYGSKCNHEGHEEREGTRKSV